MVYFYNKKYDKLIRLLVWDTARKASLEISSMGIRVDKEALIRQLELTKSVSRLMTPFHQLLVTKQLPYTIGGGIGKRKFISFRRIKHNT